MDFQNLILQENSKHQTFKKTGNEKHMKKKYIRMKTEHMCVRSHHYHLSDKSNINKYGKKYM